MAVGSGRSGARGESLAPFLQRNWRLVSVVVMALLGIGIGVYLTTEHYAKVEPICPTVGPINCSSVLRSQYSVVPFTGSPSSGIPITLPGGFFFLVSGVLAAWMLVSAYRRQQEPAWLRPALALWSLIGLLFVLYLVFAEIVLIRNICLWCTAVHILTLLTLLVALSLLQQISASAYAQPQAARSKKPQPANRQATRTATTSRVAHTSRARAQSRRATGNLSKSRSSRG